MLIEFLGESTLSRILHFLIEKTPEDVTKEEIIRETGVSRNSFFRTWQKVEAYGVVRTTRRIGRAKLYVLDEENDIAQKLLELHSSLKQRSAEAPSEGQYLSAAHLQYA